MKLKAIWSVVTALPRWVWAVLVLAVAFVWYRYRAAARNGQRARIDRERHDSSFQYTEDVARARTAKYMTIDNVNRLKLARDQAIQKRRNAIDDAEREGRAALLEQLDKVMLRRRERWE